jgi:hypothetical protein
MWKHHTIYESQPRGVIVTLGGQPYKVPEVDPTTATSLIYTKQCCNVISQTIKFSLITIQSEVEQKVIVTTTTLVQDLSIQQKKVNNILEEHVDIFSSPTRVPLHYHVPSSSDLVLGAPLPNGPVYRPSLPENGSLPYVKHNSIGHDPFQVCLGFQQLVPIGIVLLVAFSPT